MNFDPDSEVIRACGFVAELGEVESPCRGGGTVAGCAVFLDEGVGAGERFSRHAGSCEKRGRENQLQGRRPDEASAFTKEPPTYLVQPRFACM